MLPPYCEQDRLQALRSYGILDTGPEPAYDRLVRLAADALGCAGASLWFVDEDRIWFKATHGFVMDEVQRVPFTLMDSLFGLPDVVTCADVARQPELANGFGAGQLPFRLRSFGMALLVGGDGLPLGALSVGDLEPRQFSTADEENLRSAAHQAVALLELRRWERRAGIDPNTRPVQLPDRADRLRRALDENEFTLRYQPLVRLADRSVFGVEALVRWEPPGRPVVGPEHFLPALEASELMTPFGRWLRRQAVADLGALRAGLHPDLELSLNVSGREVSTPGLVEDVAYVLRTGGYRPQDLTLELTESARAENGETRVSELTALAEMGVGITIDDYGTGWSSLETLTLPAIRGLKIDKSFSARLDEPRVQRLVRHVLATAETIGASVVMEGIETPACCATALALGATMGQGYLFSRPLRVTELVRDLGAPAPERLSVSV